MYPVILTREYGVVYRGVLMFLLIIILSFMPTWVVLVFSFDRVGYEVSRLKDITILLQRYSLKPLLRVDIELESLDLIKCRERVRLTQSIMPIIEWWELFKIDRQDRDNFILREFLKLIFLVYKDYLLHLYGANYQLSSQLMQELDAAVAAADSLEQLFYVLNRCYYQIKILFNVSSGNTAQQNNTVLYIMPLVIFSIYLLEKILNYDFSEKPIATR